MKRADWDNRLSALFEARRRTAWRWGTHDCFQLMAAAVETMREGGAPWRDLDLAYGDEPGAEALIAKHGGPRAFMDRHFDPIARPRRGDVGLVHHDAAPDPAFTVFDGEMHITAAAPRGLVGLDDSRRVAAWSI